MADVLVDGSVDSSSDSTWVFGPFWTDVNTGVIVGDVSGGVSYWRTTDGGANWSSATHVGGATSNDNRGMTSWFDKQTPGDTGDVVHIAWADANDGAIYYQDLNVVTNTLGTLRTIASSLTLSGTSGRNKVSITKTVDGNLLVSLNVLSGGVIELYRSTDGGANWTNRSDVYESTGTSDFCMLYPANTTDDSDAAAIYFDDSEQDISIKMYDNSADSWTETSIDTSITQSFVFQFMHAAVRTSDGHILLVYHNDIDSSTDDLETVDINPNSIASPTITTKTNIFTNQSESALVSVIVDPTTDDVYVAYGKGGTWTAAIDIVFHKSTDGMATWGSEQAYSEDTADDLRIIAYGS